MASKALNILLVEDNEINQRLLKELVSRAGHTVSVAGTGEDAIELVKANDFDMALMDVELPGISGKGATKAIRALSDPDKAGLPVIALTGNVRDEDIRGCYAANMNGHLPKPVDPKKLQIQIEKVINNTLDNPVEIGAASSESIGMTDVTKIAEQAQQQQNNPAPAPAEEAAATPPDNFATDEAVQDELEDGDNGFEVTALRAHAFNLDDMDFSDEELDEDSFEAAIEYGSEPSPAIPKPAEKPEMVLDIKMLEDLRSNIGAAQIQELLGGFLDKVDEILNDIEAAERSGDLDMIRGRAHELKGMAANFGLNQLSFSAAELEAALKGQGPGNVKSLIDKLPDSRQAVNDAVHQWLDQGQTTQS